MTVLTGYRRTRLAVIASVVAAMLVAWGMAGAWLWRDYQRTLSSAESDLVRLSIAAADQTHHLLSLTDVFLDSLEQIIALSDGEMDTLTNPVVTERVTRMLDHVGGVLDVAVIDHDGRSTILPYSASRPLVSVRDRDYFRDARVGRITIAAPLKGRTSGEWIIPVSRRMADPTNNTSVLLAAIHIPALERLFEGVRHSRGGAINLFRGDGVTLARSPPLEGAIGRSVADGQLFQRRLPLAPQGSYIAISQLDGKERMAAYRVVEHDGLVVLVSQTMSEVLAPWRRQALLALAAMGALSVAMAIVAALLLRLLATLESGATVLDQRVTERTVELQRLMEARSGFLTSISHELRTPLNAIIGFSDALLARLHGPMLDRQAEYIKDIHLSGRHLLSLVNDLLDSAAVDSGHLSLDECDFHLGDMVDEALAMVRPRADAAGIRLDVTIEPEGMRLWADRRRLMQALLNLCINAIKYNRSGGMVAITARIEPNGECVVAVADNGIGMSAEDLKTAMTPFGRVGGRPGRAIEGTGLGLPLTSRILELHGARLSFDSAPGLGTTATIILPPDRVRGAAAAALRA